MSAPNRPARLNRALLALLGLVLVAAGGFGVALGTGLLAPLLPGLDPAGPVLPADVVLAAWTPYVAAASAILLGLLCLRWLLAQVRRGPRSGTWRLPGATTGTTRLDADRAADAIGADITGYPGVVSARATLTGPLREPALHLVVATETGAPVDAVRERIATHALPRLRQALDLDDLPTDLLLRVDAADPVRRIR